MSGYEPQSALERRFRNPTRAGRLNCGQGSVIGRATSVAEGLELRLELHVQAGRVASARFQARGCPATIAVADWLAEALEGKALGDRPRIDWVAAEAELGLPPEKRSRLLLAQDALDDALEKTLAEKEEIN